MVLYAFSDMVRAKRSSCVPGRTADMKKERYFPMKRFISLLLVLAMLWACRPAAAASISLRPSSWEAIEALEARALERCASADTEARSAAYAGSVDAMVRAVQAAGDYVPGSMERHGDFFFWQTTDGRANGYSPSLRAEIQTGAAERPVSTLGTQAPFPSADPANTADNRNVGVFIPYSDSYYFHYEDTVAQGTGLAHSSCGELKVWLQADANVNSLASAISACGILLLNSHGATDYERGTDYTSKANSSYICLPTDAGITAADQRPVSGPYGTYYHAFYNGSSNGEEYYCVDGTCVASHMQGEAPHSMVWLGCCLSMATEGLYAPLRAKGVEAMIGFSQPVTVNADEEYRGVFCRELAEGKTMGEAAAVMKEEVGCPDPYQTAHAPAWPIAVSGQDPYPGRDHVDEAQELLSTWELYPAYPIEVSLEPAGGGVVTVNRTKLTVTPNTGYRFTDWEITAGEATAEQQGNVLDFTLDGPCAVTIRFEARTPAVLELHTGPGQMAEPIAGYIGDVITLPAPEGELEADAYLYHFLGWTAVPLDADTAERPELLPAGSRLTLTEETAELWAVYGYFDAEDGEGGQFRLVDGALEDWAGDYVLTYQSAKALRADGQHTGQAVSSPSAVISNTAVGYFIDGDFLNEVPDTVVYAFVPQSDGTCLIKMKGSENYLAVTSSTGGLTTTNAPGVSGVKWRLSWSENGAVIQNARFPSKYLQYSLTSSGFCVLTTLRNLPTLYAREPGEHRYTTEPKNREPEPPAPFRFDDVQNPGAWYFSSVYWAYNHEPRITAGTSPTTFGPSESCTRAQIVTFLWHAAGDPEPTLTESPFSDVQTPTAYYYKAVLWAYENGITGGVDPLTFGVNQSCTRAQIVTFLWGFAGRPAMETDNPFTDVKPGAYYRKAVLWAVENGITAGTSPTTFSPDTVCTRAQCVTFLHAAFGD